MKVDNEYQKFFRHERFTHHITLPPSYLVVSDKHKFAVANCDSVGVRGGLVCGEEKDGEYLSFSMANIVCRVTPTLSAKVC